MHDCNKFAVEIQYRNGYRLECFVCFRALGELVKEEW